jgi:ABC-type bacteriocin/lantibiotic exporter with double-glycine peptidase domain
MSVEVAKQIESVRTELSAQIAEVKTSQVEVKASTKAKPEVAQTSNSNVKLTRNQKILNNIKNLN